VKRVFGEGYTEMGVRIRVCGEVCAKRGVRKVGMWTVDIGSEGGVRRGDCGLWCAKGCEERGVWRVVCKEGCAEKGVWRGLRRGVCTVH